MKTEKSPLDVFQAYLHRSESVSKGTITPNWFEDGDSFWYSEGAPYNTVIYVVDLKLGECTPIFDVPLLRKLIAAEVGYDMPYQGLPFDTLLFANHKSARFIFNGSLWEVTFLNGNMKTLCVLENKNIDCGDADEEKYWMRTALETYRSFPVPESKSPDGQWFASVKDSNIFLRSSVDQRYQRVTDNGNESFFWDFEVPQNRYLPGILVESTDGVNPWSPDSLTLLAYKRDHHSVSKQSRVHWLKPLEEVEYLPISRAGTGLEMVVPFFINVRNGEQSEIKLPEFKNRYIRQLSWLYDGAEVLLISYSRDMKSLEIFAADVKTGDVRSLMTELADTFVKIQHDVIMSGNSGFTLLNDDTGFLWLSTRDGYNHIYHYDMNGNLIGQLTEGDWPVYDISGVRTDGFVYFTAAVNVSRPYDIHICRVPLRGGAIEQLSQSEGIHTPTFSLGVEATAFIDTHSSVDRPSVVDLLALDGAHIDTLSEMDISDLEEVGYVSPEEFVVEAADDETDLWGVLYKPYNFDSDKSYPVIEYIYGGPQIICAHRHFSIGEDQYSNMPWALAQLGYIVVCLDARGTPGRSKVFQDTVYKAWARHQIPDHAAAIRQLCKTNHWMDANKVGITGHSWGGYYATLALIQAPDVYHAAVAASSGGFEPTQIVHEPYLGLIKDDRVPYDEANLLRQASGVKGSLMLIASTSDNVNSPIKMTHALMEAGIDHEFVILPGAQHEYVGAEQDYYLKKLTGWFDRHLKNRQSAS